MATSSKKMMAGFFFKLSSLAPCCLLVEKQGVFALGSPFIVNIIFILYFLFLLPKQKVFLKYSNLICRYKDNR